MKPTSADAAGTLLIERIAAVAMVLPLDQVGHGELHPSLATPAATAAKCEDLTKQQIPNTNLLLSIRIESKSGMAFDGRVCVLTCPGTSPPRSGSASALTHTNRAGLSATCPLNREPLLLEWNPYSHCLLAVYFT